ncbi:hypothetical protein [Pseudonocardia phyllosphaerae]|uniref:hypothetical protein n=1 Tax=Pseudonocardia phyllosphaerae TaxID=3390502 RepID=UPI0039781845
MNIEAGTSYGTTPDALLSQITPDEVVAVHALLATRAEQLRALPADGTGRTRDAQIRALREAADRVREAARECGYSDRTVELAVRCTRRHFAR